MKVLLCLVAVFALTVSAVPVEQEQNRVSGENGWYVPQLDGSVVWTAKEDAELLLEEAKMKESRGLFDSVVKFYLYTKSNPTDPQEIFVTKESIAASNFNPAVGTRFSVHGWTSSYKDQLNSLLRDAWFTHGDFNMIAVDWSRARSIDYYSSVIAINKAGSMVAEMVDFLHTDFGMSFETLDVVGHSLGAHVAGFTGKHTKTGQVHTVIALDPAMPLFNHDKPETRVSDTDGFYVESIHTDGGVLGFLKPIGKASFYPNGGRNQPGCGVDSGCSHSRAVIFYAESIRMNNYPSIKCGDYTDAVAKECGSTYSSSRLGSVVNAYMAEGNFYVPVNSVAPYGMGA